MIIDPKSVLRTLLMPPQPAVYQGGGYCLAQGPAGFPVWGLTTLTGDLPPGVKVIWVDGSGDFTPVTLIQAADAWGIPPFHYLSRVELAKPQSPHQLLRVVLSELAPRGADSWPVVFSDPVPLFLNSDGTAKEKQDLFEEFLSGLGRLKMPVLVLDVQRSATAMGPSSALIQNARAVAAFAPEEGAWDLKSFHRPAMAEQPATASSVLQQLN